MKRILVVLGFFLAFAVTAATADIRGHDGAELLRAKDSVLALDRVSAGASSAHCPGGEFPVCHALSQVDGPVAAPSELRRIRLVASAGALAGDAVFRREPKPPRL